MSKHPPRPLDILSPRGRAATSRIKAIGKMLARRLLKVDVHGAPTRKYDLYAFQYANTVNSRFLHFCNLINEVKGLDGVIVECGVGVGESLFHFSTISNSIGKPRRIYIWIRYVRGYP